MLYRLRDVSLDTGILAPGGPPPLARGVELCDCPPQYNSTSCQDPSIGFYRWYDNNSISSTIVIQLVGEARPCQCNQRSKVCDIETGYCLVSAQLLKLSEYIWLQKSKHLSIWVEAKLIKCLAVVAYIAYIYV